jgi:hypothetical protein
MEGTEIRTTRRLPLFPAPIAVGLVNGPGVVRGRSGRPYRAGSSTPSRMCRPMHTRRSAFHKGGGPVGPCPQCSSTLCPARPGWPPGSPDPLSSVASRSNRRSPGQNPQLCRWLRLRSKPRRAATAVSVGLPGTRACGQCAVRRPCPYGGAVSEVSAARAEVVIGQHMFYLAQDGRWPRQWAAPPNGLVTVYDGVAIVLVGASSGVVAVQVSPAAAAPAQSGYTELGRRGGSQHAYR